MNLKDIKLKLENQNMLVDVEIIERLKELKQVVVNNNQEEAKEIWCLEQVILI